ncbi:hypothetical protein CK203_066759 [Vitis vinifera]|uniref:Uncharacterized protein n=1 Tax=Vitis vinifera TaxID=29760 RepID=A0A438EVS8_VITVI|nr:hypothetical protein CK203_066759 [Vitis vinifera]
MEMTVSGLTGSPLRYCLHVPAQGLGSLSRQVSASGNIVKFGENMALHCLKRSYWDISTHGYSIKKAHLIKCSMGASYGDMADDPTECLCARRRILDAALVANEAIDLWKQSSNEMMNVDRATYLFGCKAGKLPTYLGLSFGTLTSLVVCGMQSKRD